MRGAVTVAMVCGALALAACGGDDNGGGGEGDAFVSQADDLCTTAAEERVALDTRVGPPQSDQDAIELVEGATVIEEDLIAGLEELEPPEDVAADFDEFIAQRQEAVDMGEDAIAAAERSDPEQFNEISTERDDLLDDARQSAEDAGLGACAEILPEEAVAEITAAIEEGATGGDTSCEDLYTDNYIEVYHGGDVEQCDSDTPPAESVEVSDVYGIEGASGEAVATLSGGQADGSTFDVNLIDEDGTWKIDSINPAGE